MPVLYRNKKHLKEKKNSNRSKSCLQDEACLRIKTESPNVNYDTSMHMFECSQKSSDNLPAPIADIAPTPPRHCAVLFSLSGWSAVTFTK